MDFRRCEGKGRSPLSAHLRQLLSEVRFRHGAAAAIRAALETAGVIFVEENGEGPGVRLRKAALEKNST